MGRPPITNKQFEEKYLKDKNITRIGKYINNFTPVDLKCNKCNHKWSANSDVLRRSGCPKCAGNAKLGQTEVKKRLNKNNIELIGRYKGMNHKIEVSCKKCNHKWSTIASCVLGHETGCPNCANKVPLTKKIVKQRLIDNKRDIVLLGEIQGSAIKTEWKCKICKHEWLAKPNSIFATQSGCPKCANNVKYNQTQTGKVISELIDENFVEKEKMLNEQVILGNEIIRSKLFLDYFIKLNGIRTIIEYNGRQHYAPVPRFGGEKEFKKVQTRDRWLRSYCEENDINLIEIDGRKKRGYKKIKEFLEPLIKDIYDL